MQVKRCILHGKAIRSLDDLYDCLSRELAFPDYFGRNLDALWDILATDMEGPLEVVWEEAEASRSAMGEDFERAAALLRDLERERDDVRVFFR
jgi:ribonuclease inhibitor